MISSAVKELQATKKKYLEQINGLQGQVQKIDSALAALTGTAVSSAVEKPVKKYKMTAAHKAALKKAQAARWAKAKGEKTPTAESAPVAKKKQKPMSPLGKLRIKLGALNRYGKKDEAKQVAAKIAALEAKK
jgi:hypothetical protein